MGQFKYYLNDKRVNKKDIDENECIEITNFWDFSKNERRYIKGIKNNIIEKMYNTPDNPVDIIEKASDE